MSAPPKIILGIDPGTNWAGYGVIGVAGGKTGAMRCLELGDIDMHLMQDPYSKLRKLFNEVSIIIERVKPDEVALESPFFGENVQSMLKLGRAQGVAMAAALSRGIPVWEYAPRRIKQSITGQGGASKEQVAALLRSMLKVEYDLKRLDATDGLAVAVCHHFISTSPVGESTPKRKMSRSSESWESFLTKNPERIKK
ncbi:MAG: crossover junction endodeoxyribonuclease RuvC [Rikenellaceae bacterium]|jgi:crossover junction endodeoxyribonuclease RuvC|nr:crossover junction endodeoxyribonuclease RuvC [Rikenellaceae bacterium]